jgi:hypothetical protein
MDLLLVFSFISNTFRPPDVVEFAVSPQAGQAVLACPPAPN